MFMRNYRPIEKVDSEEFKGSLLQSLQNEKHDENEYSRKKREDEVESALNRLEKGEVLANSDKYCFTTQEVVHEKQNVSSSEIDVPGLSRRGHENSRSDISQLSILQSAVTPLVRGGWDNKSEFPKTFNSNKRKVETSQSEISAIEKSPFLQLRQKPFVFMFGKQFEYFQKLRNISPDRGAKELTKEQVKETEAEIENRMSNDSFNLKTNPAQEGSFSTLQFKDK